MIYFDNAATSKKKPDEVIEAVVAAMTNLGNAGRGVNAASLDAGRIVLDTRKKIAKLFNIKDCNNIAFTYNSTESLNIAIKGFLMREGIHAISTILEHNSVLRPLYECEKKGLEIDFVRADELGNPKYEEFESLIRNNTKAIICTHASNLTGNIVDIGRIGKLCKERGIIFIVDASQTAGVIPIDVEDMNIDILCFTGHKSLLAPQGTGGIYINPELYIEGLKSGGTGINTYSKIQPKEMPTRLEAGTLNVHGIAGLNAALSYIERYGIDNIRNKEEKLCEYFYSKLKELSEISDIKIYGDFSSFNRCPIVSINIEDIDSSEIGDILYSEFEISVRSGGHCAPLMHEHFETKEQGMVRFSFSHFNTIEEIDFCIESLKNILGHN